MQIHFAGYTLDVSRRQLRRGEEPVHLSPKAFDLLRLLSTRYPDAVSKAEILNTIWPDTFVIEANVPILVKEIRSALGDDARRPKFVRTVFAYGYALATDVSVDHAVSRQHLGSIAVLPLASDSRPEWDFLGEGISESLINTLAGWRGMRVTPRTTSFRYGNSNEEPVAVGRKLNVDAILSGRVRVVDGTLAVQVDLIDVRSESQLWGEKFQRSATDFADLPGEIAREIAAKIETDVEAVPNRNPVPTRNGEAYRHYLLGRHFWSRRESRSFQRALDSFATAAKLDGSFALAHAGSAETYVALGTRDLLPPREVFPRAKAAALHALELDSRLAAAHTALAAVQELYEWDWDGAESTHRTAIGLDPQYATAANWFALHLARRGRHNEAEEWMSKALELEPASTIINTNAALISYLAGDFERAVTRGEVAVDLDPAYESSRFITGAARTHTDPDRAVSELEEVTAMSGRPSHLVACLAFACARAGQMDAARALRAEIEHSVDTGYSSAANRALAALACDDLEKALVLLELAAESRSPWLSYLKTDKRLDVIRPHTTFRRIEAMIGF